MLTAIFRILQLDAVSPLVTGIRVFVILALATVGSIPGYIGYNATRLNDINKVHAFQKRPWQSLCGCSYVPMPLVGPVMPPSSALSESRAAAAVRFFAVQHAVRGGNSAVAVTCHVAVRAERSSGKNTLGYLQVRRSRQRQRLRWLRGV